MTPVHRGIIMLAPTMAVPARQIKELRAAGYIPLIGNPAEVKFVLPSGAEMDGTALTVAAFKTINMNDQRRTDFGKLMLESIMAQIDAQK